MPGESRTRLKLVSVVAITAAASIFVVGVLKGYLGPSISVVAGLITIVAGIREGHRYVSQKELTAANPEGVDFGLFATPSLRDLEPDDEFAKEILNSRDWHKDGHGSHPTLGREILYRIFYRFKFSNTRMEVAILVLTSLGLALFCVIMVEVMSVSELIPNYLLPIAELYPDRYAPSESVFPTFASFLLISLGMFYFGEKRLTTCPDGVPFALKSKGRFFKPENLREKTKENDGEEYQVEVAIGYQLYRCQEHDQLFVRQAEWERE